MQVLTGVSGTSGKGKTAVTTQAWTATWPSTTIFNSSITVSAFAVDVFGNTSAAHNLNLTIQNKLVTQTGTAHVCWPSSSSCPNTIWQPVTTAVATEAAVHLQGTVTYNSQQNVKYSDFWLQVAAITSSGGFAYYCGVPTTTVDCYPALLLEPNGSKTLSNSSGGQIDVIPNNNRPASEQADIQWTLTYPQ
jgi:hypothetical protein